MDNSYKWAGGGLLSTVGDLVKFGNVMLYSFQHDDGADQVQGENKPNVTSKYTKTNTNSANIENGPTMDGVGANVNLRGYLKQKTVQKLWTVVENAWPGGEIPWGYGMGWSVMPESHKYGFCEHQRYFVSHSGGALGASSILLVYPRNEVTKKQCGTESHGQSEGHQPSPVKTLLDEDNQLSDNVVSHSPPGGPTPLPQGIIVAVIANSSPVGLSKTAFNIAQIFEQVDR